MEAITAAEIYDMVDEFEISLKKLGILSPKKIWIEDSNNNLYDLIDYWVIEAQLAAITFYARFEAYHDL